MKEYSSPVSLSPDHLQILLARGASAELFDLGEGRVLKLFHDSVSEDMIAREMEASVHAESRGVPTAAAVQRAERGGRRGIIYPRLHGPTAMDWIRRHPGRGGWMLDQLGALQNLMHSKDGGSLRRLKQVLATDIRYGPAPVSLQQAAIAYLDDLPDGDQLTHGDFHLGNVMVTLDGLKIIDWSKAARGHPAADAVRSEMLMRFGIGPNDWITNIWRDWAAQRSRKAYLAVADATAADVARWRPIVALAWLRARNAGRTPTFMRYLDDALRKNGIGTLN